MLFQASSSQSPMAKIVVVCVCKTEGAAFKHACATQHEYRLLKQDSSAFCQYVFTSAKLQAACTIRQHCFTYGFDRLKYYFFLISFS